MKNKSITIYVLETSNYDGDYYIKKRIVEISKTDIVVKDNGRITITLVNSWQNSHNGDFEDEDIYGYETYELAKKEWIRRIKDKISNYEQQIKKIETMKEPKKCLNQYYF
jgi:hypothetical protein